MQLRQQEQRERVQLIHDNKTGEYLNYRQLIRDLKHTKIWSKSATNEFGRLVQGVGGRVKPTNTIFVIRKDQVPKDQIKDVTYGSFSCDIKPNKEEKHQTQLTHLDPSCTSSSLPLIKSTVIATAHVLLPSIN
jgi:hypothetical protein